MPVYITVVDCGHLLLSYLLHDTTKANQAMRLLQLSCLLLSLLLQFAETDPILKKFRCETSDCCDQHEWCQFWASIGECQSNSFWMADNCQLACATCPNRERDAGGRGNVSRCSAPSNHLDKLQSDHLIVASEDVSKRRTLTANDVALSNTVKKCVSHLDYAGGDCSRQLCYHLSYRTMDGTCNNLHQPLKGAAFTPYIRLKPAEYDDGISEPIAALKTEKRPNARKVSRVILSSGQSVVKKQQNGLLMQFGQLLAHDLAKTTLLPVTPCTSCQSVKGQCIAVPVQNDDTNDKFKQFGCLRMSRSSPLCGTGRDGAGRDGTGQQEPRQQLNQNTAFIDASVVYGSSTGDMAKLREGRSALLRTVTFHNQTVAPFDSSKCTGPDRCSARFEAGDNRANLFLGLAAMHILFTRHHNRIAMELTKMNPRWDGDRVFQETRKIMGAIMQVITYNEWLPKILGVSMASVIGPYIAYNSSIDPSISNQFTTASFRFGHGMIQEFYERIGIKGRRMGGLKFDQCIFKSEKILFEGGIDPILRGMAHTAAKRPQRITAAVTEDMFGATDLATINIERGREHGIGSYNVWRQFCGLKRAETFDDLAGEMLDVRIRRSLQQQYPHPDNVDLYVGAMVEDPVLDGLVGTTLACLLGDQFRRLRDGDRFWYENAGIFSRDQVVELKKASLAAVLCDSGDSFGAVPADAFSLASKLNLLPCHQIVRIDLSKWKS